MNDLTRAASGEIVAILTRLRSADTAYRAWVAVALLHAPDARQHATGKQTAADVLNELPRPADGLEHGDIASLAILSTDFLSADDRMWVATSLPQPNTELVHRARLFKSPLYVYLVVRGLGPDLPNAERFAAFVESDATQTAQHPEADLVDLMLQLATAIELAATRAIPDTLLRSIHARLVASAGNPDAALSVRWLLNRYIDRWPSGPEATTLRRAAEEFVERYAPITADVSGLRLEVAAMQVETAVLQPPNYRLVSDAIVQREVNARLTRQRLANALVYAAMLSVVCGIPAWWLVVRSGLPVVAAIAAALGLWLPVAAWSTLAHFDRRPSIELPGAVAFAVIYYVIAGYAAIKRNSTLLDLVGTDILIAYVPLVLAPLIAAAYRARKTTQG